MLQIIHTTDPRHINSPLSAQATNAHVDGTDASGTARRRSKGSRPMRGNDAVVALAGDGLDIPAEGRGSKRSTRPPLASSSQLVRPAMTYMSRAPPASMSILTAAAGLQQPMCLYKPPLRRGVGQHRRRSMRKVELDQRLFLEARQQHL